MAFDQSGIEARGYREGVSLVVEWTSPAAEGTVFQVYSDRHLIWAGTARRAVLPYVGGGDSVDIDVGAVAAGESTTDFSASLVAVPEDRARLTWSGGTYLSEDIEGFNVYMGATPGGAVDYDERVGYVPAYAASLVTASFGDGTFGGGSFGYPEASYAWTSGRLASGEWSFGVTPVDAAGNEGDAEEVAVMIEAAPRPPAADADGVRLAATYDDSTFEATLTWLASPG